MNARLMAALLSLERWLAQQAFSDPEVSAVIDYLWRWPTVGESTDFADWDLFWSDTLSAALGGTLPPSVGRAAADAGLQPATLHQVLSDTVEIVHGNLFAAVDDSRTLQHLCAVEKTLRGDGVALPDPALFENQGVSEYHGWGAFITEEAAGRLRNAQWHQP